jgi:hypothetical protein
VTSTFGGASIIQSSCTAAIADGHPRPSRSATANRWGRVAHPLTDPATSLTCTNLALSTQNDVCPSFFCRTGVAWPRMLTLTGVGLRL